MACITYVESEATMYVWRNVIVGKFCLTSEREKTLNKALVSHKVKLHNSYIMAEMGGNTCNK